jgi:hypothetical protein
MAIVAVIGLLAVFSIISIVLSGKEDPSRPTEPLDNPFLWVTLGRR